MTLDPEGGFGQLMDMGRGFIAAIDPVASMAAVENAALAPVAQQVRAQLKSVIEGL